MSNELVVIEEENALAVLSKADGVDRLIEDVRERVMSLDGGSLKTVTGRKNIRSNAFKATKAKTAINEQHIQPLIDKVTKKIQPDLDTIQALKDNRKRLNTGLDQVRKDVNAEVQAIDDEIKRKEEEKAAAEEAKRIAAEIEQSHEVAILMNEKHDREALERIEEEHRIEAERQKKLEAERIASEEEIRKQAAAEAELKAKEEAERIEREKQQAIEAAAEAERQRIAAEERAKLEAELAEKRRIEAEAKAKRDSEAAAERARLAEIARQEAEKEAEAVAEAGRAADKENRRKVNNSILDALVAAGIPEDHAKLAVMAIAKGSVPHLEIKY